MAMLRNDSHGQILKRTSNSTTNSKAVLSALHSLQDKVRVLEAERNTLQLDLKESQEVKKREEQQQGVLSRQLELHLQESMRSLKARHGSEVYALRTQANELQGELAAEAKRLGQELSKAKAEVQLLRDECLKVERDYEAKDEEVRRLRKSVADLEAAGVALMRTNQQLEVQANEDEKARKELIACNAILEEDVRMLKSTKLDAEARVAQAAKEHGCLQAEHALLKRREAQLEQEMQQATETMAQKAKQTAASTAERSALLNDKRQLEDSLRNVLSVNDQLLQKLYESSLNSVDQTLVGADREMRAVAWESETTQTARRIEEQTLESGRRCGRERGDTERGMRSKSSSAERATRAEKMTPGYEASTLAYRTHLVHTQKALGKRGRARFVTKAPASNEATKRPQSDQTASLPGDRRGVHKANRLRAGKKGPKIPLHVLDLADAQVSPTASNRAPLKGVQQLENELREEVCALRKQYRDICAQVQATERSQFDSQQLNVALCRLCCMFACCYRDVLVQQCPLR